MRAIVTRERRQAERVWVGSAFETHYPVGSAGLEAGGTVRGW